MQDSKELVSLSLSSRLIGLVLSTKHISGTRFCAFILYVCSIVNC